MSLIDLIYLSQKSLRSNILRSVLTSLGIIIGVSSVITMISIGAGARLEVEQQIERFGSNNLILRSTVIYGWHNRSRFTNWVLKNLKSRR